MKSEFDLERMERICRNYASNQAAAQALLGYVAEMTDPQACSFLAAIQDGSIGHVLNLIHQYISRNIWN